MHKPVMLQEVLQYLAPKDGEVYVDATFGAGGYTKAILAAANCTVFGIDQDPLAKKIANEIKGNFKFLEGNFGDLAKLVDEKVDGIVFDIGVSSMQIDEAARGFSFMREGPLDMRMSSSGISAHDVVNKFQEKELADIIYKYGEEKNSRRIAKEIVASRPLNTTLDLAEVVRRNSSPKYQMESLSRVFQALRIFVNNELENLERGLESALALLKNGGRLIVVTFHSLEDRIVKLFFRKRAEGPVSGNRHLPTIHNSHASELKIITKKSIAPSEQEIEFNPRARSAKLRAAIYQGDVYE